MKWNTVISQALSTSTFLWKIKSHDAFDDTEMKKMSPCIAFSKRKWEIDLLAVFTLAMEHTEVLIYFKHTSFLLLNEPHLSLLLHFSLRGGKVKLSDIWLDTLDADFRVFFFLIVLKRDYRPQRESLVLSPQHNPNSISNLMAVSTSPRKVVLTISLEGSG